MLRRHYSCYREFNESFPLSLPFHRPNQGKQCLMYLTRIFNTALLKLLCVFKSNLSLFISATSRCSFAGLLVTCSLSALWSSAKIDQQSIMHTSFIINMRLSLVVLLGHFAPFGISEQQEWFLTATSALVQIPEYQYNEIHRLPAEFFVFIFI